MNDSWAITRKTLIFSQVFASFVAFAGTAHAQALTWTSRCVSDSGVATIQGFECLLSNILTVATTFIGLAAFVMLIIGAFLFLTSGDSPKGAEAGRQTMTYAIIGIIVALMAAFILQIISRFTGVGGFLNFNLYLNSSTTP